MTIVSIVTVNFNEESVTLDFLASIYKEKGDFDLEVILVDNGSDENNEVLFTKIYPNLIYIRSEKNLGFAGGNNLGIKRALGDYILLLNNDTEITSNLISTLVSEMESNPDIGLISPLILYHEDKKLIQYAGFSKMNYLTGRNKTIGQFEIDRGQYDNSSHETGFCHGAAMMCRKKDLVEVGLMEENYFLYYEEMDWCEKFKRNGKKIWFTGKAKVYHKESVSVGKESNLKTYFVTRNRLLFIRKNAPIYKRIIFGFYFYSLAGPALMIKYLFLKKKSHVKWVWKGMLWNLTRSKKSKRLGYPILKN